MAKTGKMPARGLSCIKNIPPGVQTRAKAPCSPSSALQRSTPADASISKKIPVNIITASYNALAHYE
jgi:hypothetical protein